MSDLRLAFRQLAKSPGFTATAILAVAIGIGACTALFSVVGGVLLRPLPFAQPERIVSLYETKAPGDRRIRLSPATYLEWAKQSASFAHLAVYSSRSYTTKLGDRALVVEGQTVTASFFPVLGVEPSLGRIFLPEEETPGRNQVAVLSHRAWTSQFDGRADVIGQTISLNDRPHTIVGVLPDEKLLDDSAVFTPLAFSAADAVNYGSHGLAGIGRLKPGVALAQAQADLDVISQRIALAHPASNAGQGARVLPLRDDVTGGVRLQLLVLLGAVGFVLLIACINVASLLLARAHSRRKEIAVRTALGASRARIVRLFLGESFLLAIAGGALGVLLAAWSIGAVAQFAGRYLPRTEEIALDGPVLGVALGLMLVVGFAAGLAPALQFTRGSMADPLKEAGRGNSGGRQRLRSGLVVTEIALAVMLLVGAGLLGRSLMALQRTDQGFDAGNVHLDRLWLRGEKYNTPQKMMAFVHDASERIAARPEVRDVAFANALPIIGSPGLLYHIAGTPEVPVKDMPLAGQFFVTPNYFHALGVPLLRGRGFTEQDTPAAPRVAIINQELAQRHFSGRDPLGQRIMIMTMDDKADVEREIVGVVGNVRPHGPQSEIMPQVYEPFAQRAQAGLMNLIVKTRAPAPAWRAAVGDIIHALDPDLPFHHRHDFDALVADSWFRQRFNAILFTLFSGIALLLAAIGIYGVMAYSVTQRSNEIGIRMAFGARRADVLRLILGQGGRLVVFGLAGGVLGSLLLTRYLTTLLFGVTAHDPLTFIAIAMLLAAVAALACLIPARRATQVDPMIALRAE